MALRLGSSDPPLDFMPDAAQWIRASSWRARTVRCCGDHRLVFDGSWNVDGCAWSEMVCPVCGKRYGIRHTFDARIFEKVPASASARVVVSSAPDREEG